MNNSKPGGIRHRRPDIGGRPRSDANYGPKKRFDKKPGFAPSGSGGRGDSRGSKEMQMFTTNCTSCGKSCEVPFKPDGSKPVLCRDCFAQKNAAPGGASSFERRGRPDDRRPERNYDAPRVPSVPGVTKADLAQITNQITALELKIAELLTLVKSNNSQPEQLQSQTDQDAPKKASKKVTKKTATK